MTDLVKRLRKHPNSLSWEAAMLDRQDALAEIERLHEIIEQRSIANRKVVIEDIREWGKHRYVNTVAGHLDAYCKDRNID